MNMIINEVEKFRSKKELYMGIIEALENEDWDCQQECMGKSKDFDAALKELHPELFEEE